MQTELLQAQNEVRCLLDRVGEATRERSEMVSNRVHNQLLQIADEKAAAAERRAKELEREVRTCVCMCTPLVFTVLVVFLLSLSHVFSLHKIPPSPPSPPSGPTQVHVLRQTQAIGSSQESTKFGLHNSGSRTTPTASSISFSSFSSSFPTYPGLSTSNASSLLKPSSFSPLSPSLEHSPYSQLAVGGNLGDVTAPLTTSSSYVTALFDQAEFSAGVYGSLPGGDTGARVGGSSVSAAVAWSGRDSGAKKEEGGAMQSDGVRWGEGWGGSGSGVTLSNLVYSKFGWSDTSVWLIKLTGVVLNFCRSNLTGYHILWVFTTGRLQVWHGV